MLRSRLATITTGVVIGAVVAGGISYAAIPHAKTKQITACILKSGTNKGATRIIDAQRGATCKSTETEIEWSATGVNWRGNWNQTAAYEINDVVYYEGTSWRARTGSLNVEPGSSPANWTYLARAGAEGPEGPQGPPGQDGTDGQDAALQRPGHVVTEVDVVADHDVGDHPSATIGIDGLLVAAHRDVDDQALRVTHCDDVACSSATSTTVDDPAASVGVDTSITIGADGFPIIAHRDVTNAALRITSCADVACTSATSGNVDDPATNAGAQTSITLGIDGRAVIAHLDTSTNGLRVSHCDDATCTTASTIDIDDGSAMGITPAITIGVDGLPVISHRNSTSGSLMVTHCDDVSCSTSTTTNVDDPAASVGWDAAIAIGTDGNPIIAHRNDSAVNLRVTRCADVECTSATSGTLDSELGAGYSSDVVVGDDGMPLVAHYDSSGGFGVRITRCADAACTTATSAAFPTGTVVQSLGLALGPDGLPIVAYRAAGSLWVMHCSNRYCLPHHRAR